MATRHASAVKAHRQTIKRTAHNRELRSKLRTGLKAIRAAIDAGRRTEAKSAPSKTSRSIDKMSAKGIIHDNAAGRYKSRLVKRLAEVERRSQVVRSGMTPDLGPSTSRQRRAAAASGQLHHQPLDQHTLVAARALEREVRAQQRLERGLARDRRRASASRRDTHQRNCPTSACGESPRSSRRPVSRSARAGVAVADRIDDAPIVLDRVSLDALPSRRRA